MVRSCEFAVLRLSPDAARGEAINLGVVVFGPTGVDMRIGEVRTRARILYPELSEQLLSDWLKNFKRLACADLPVRELHRALQRVGPLSLGELGQFAAEDDIKYEAQVSTLIGYFVKPQRVHAKRERGASRLVTTIRGVFRSEKVLANVGDAAAIEEHKIVPEWPLPTRPSLRASLALKNRLMRVCEVVELDLSDDAPPPPALFSGVVTLDVAQREASAEQCIFAYRARGPVARIDEALGIAHLHANKLVDWDVQQQRQNFIDEWIEAAQGRNLI